MHFGIRRAYKSGPITPFRPNDGGISLGQAAAACDSAGKFLRNPMLVRMSRANREMISDSSCP